jgi:DNA ligase D-like protein (predicted 3'-phosphoesterase)
MARETQRTTRGARGGPETRATPATRPAAPDARHGRLAEYRRRRDFERTREPDASAAAAPDAVLDTAPGQEDGRSNGRPVFVVQVHDARRMHFDFRLEADGVLKSWAVPRGPSADPREKRLATATEDHPMEYRTFEGVIPPGEYGGGTVMVWDEGTFRNLSAERRSGREIPLAEAIERGHASFWLDGHKLHGAYALTRMRADGQDREAWLLVKKDSDRYAAAEQERDPHRLRSARTGRTLRQIALDGAADPPESPRGREAAAGAGRRRADRGRYRR